MWDIRWQEVATTAPPFPLRLLIPSFALRRISEGDLRGLLSQIYRTANRQKVAVRRQSMWGQLEVGLSNVT